MTIWETPLNEIQDVEFRPQFVPRPNPLPVPAAGIFDAPTMCFHINQFWASHLIGVLEALDQLDAWIGDDVEVEAARQQVRELIAKLGAYCMDDPCCPEELEIQHNIELSQLQDRYNRIAEQNAQQIQENRGVYDGTPSSIYYGAGSNFNSGGDGILCSAIDAFIGQMVAFVAARTALAAALLGIGAAAVSAALVALGVFTAGASAVVGVAIGTALAVGLAEVEEAWNNPAAQKKVKCCMFDALVDTELTQTNFESSLSGCAFDAGSPEERIRAHLSPMLADEANWLAFLQALNIASDQSTERCDCDCSSTEIEIIAVSPQTTVTRLTDTTWHIVGTWQSGTDPARPDARTAHIRDQFYRCIDLIGATQGMSDSGQRDCVTGEWTEQIGGTGGEAIEFRWRQWSDDIDTVLTIECPEA